MACERIFKAPTSVEKHWIKLCYSNFKSLNGEKSRLEYSEGSRSQFKIELIQKGYGSLL